MAVNAHDRLVASAGCILVVASLFLVAAAAAADQQLLASDATALQSHCNTDDVACLRKLLQLQAGAAALGQYIPHDRKLLGSGSSKKEDVNKKADTSKGDKNKGSDKTNGNSDSGDEDSTKSKGKDKHDAPPTLGHGDGKGKYFAKKAYEKNLLHSQEKKNEQKIKDKYGPHHKKKHVHG